MILKNAQSPQFRVLSEEQCEQLFQAALECLQKVGMKIFNPEARDLLASSGASVAGELVLLPPALVHKALETVPSTFSVGRRDGQPDMQVALDRVHFGPGPTCTYFVDPATGERRKARRGDAGLTARVCDALNNIDYIMGLSLFDDVTPVLSPVYEFAESLANTTKPVIAWAYTPATLQDIHAMALAVAGGEAAFRAKPNFIFFTTYESPLKLAHDPVANLMWSAGHGIPVVCLGGPTVGLESPFTGASALVIHLATVLCALAIVQCKCPGAPTVLGGVPSMMDLRSGRPAYGSPEMSLHSAAAVDLARHLHVPFMGTAGASESKLLDTQAGIEGSLQVLLSALSGASLVHDVGFLDCADIGSLPYLVLSDEIIAMAARVMRGIPVSPETIMLDLIEKVGPGSLYLTEARSASLCRREAWVPTILDRSAYALWDKAGRKQTEQLVLEKLDKILKTHTPAPMPAGVSEEIKTILAEAEAREKVA
jgi:trimethylamine---corrinoid protein Co-methyltransferase